MPLELIKFRGVDYFNRPVFRSITHKRNFYGCTYRLFAYDATEDDVLDEIDERDLCFFGNSFGCEPEGWEVDNIKIITKQEHDEILRTKKKTDHGA